MAGEVKPDKHTFIAALGNERDPRQVTKLIMSAMGLSYEDIVPIFSPEPDAVKSLKEWVNGGNTAVDQYDDSADILRTASLFLLRRGIVGPSSTGDWLKEPNDYVFDGMTPLEGLSLEGGLDVVLDASTTFTRPEY